ncbi:DUF1707 domain-containing protein [Amycolatopsis sp.]|uniref:DUF1707 SHOCT-like domain-containing protein n=1 Tax=Amycolatopsis sp. TaxID=37632 RepID=UPI002CFE5ADE|nr:DUF1707 domain-containing protein [Amycolatopsis sp.]HVV13156.1 DUF1707 domain-containing protein [Amycolatopsis sp.]
MNPGPSSPEIRISDSDRESALTALGEHMSAGRLDIDEYGERSAQVTAAKTRGDLAGIFTDLPAPHPDFGGQPAAGAAPRQTVESAKPATPTTWAERPLNQRLTAAAIPIVWIAGLALCITTGMWWFIALPFALTAIGRGLWGADWEHEQRRDAHRRELRDRRRDFRDRRRY